MEWISKRVLAVISVLVLVAVFLTSMGTLASAAEGRATFDTGGTVKNTWKALAGGLDNVTAIQQYTGDSVPEGVDARTVSAFNSQLPIYSWFDDGTIYYWSEDTHPYTNPTADYMFNGFTKATVVDVAPFDTSKTTSMIGMFANLFSVEELDVSGFDTSNVRCMYCMFYRCIGLKKLDLSHFDVSRVTSTTPGDNYGSLCGMFISCASLTELDLSNFDMRGAIGWPYNVQNMFNGCSSLQKLTLGPNVRFNGFTSLSGGWTHQDSGLTLSGSALTSGYTEANSLDYSGVWIRNMPEGHYYRTDGSLGEENLWEVHTPDDRFKGYCLNLNKYGVGPELDRVLAEDDAEIEKLLCTEGEGSVHGCAPLGSTMREALITLIYYGWPNDGAGIQQRYGLSDQEYLDITQNAIWDFTDRYDDPSGPSHYEGDQLAAYNELVSQRFGNIEGEYILFLYKAWDPTKQNLLSIMGVDDREYGGVAVRKQSENGADNLAGAEFTVYNQQGEPVGTMVTSANGVAYICRTDHTAGLPLGNYTVRETKPPAGYFLSDIEYHFTVSQANEIVTDGWYNRPDGTTVEEEMIYYDKHDDDYVGGGVGIIKQSDTGLMLVGAEFAIYDDQGNEVATLVTNNGGVAATGKQDLPLGNYTIRETRAPEGHTIVTQEQSFQITQNMEFITLTFTDNEKRGSATLQAQKVLDAEDRVLEEGAFTFQLLDDHYRVIQTATNDAEGNVVFDTIQYTPDDLGYKNYHIIEVIGDDETIGYDRHQEDVTVTIYDPGDGSDTLDCTPVYDSDGAVFVNTLDVRKYEVSFLKAKFGTNTLVEGAALELRDTSNRLIDKWTSSGEVHTVVLDPGTYILREMTAPAGYFEFPDIRFKVLADGTIECNSSYAEVDGLSLKALDKAIDATGIKIFKADDETNAPLGGAEFTLEGGNGYSSTVTTEEDGTALFESVETGTYTLTETNPPKGYRADETTWTVEVSYNRAISKTGNISASGTAAGIYSNEVITDTVTIPGAESIHVELKYQTEDNYDYLELLDQPGGNVITQDKDGNTIGDTRANYKGHLWGGMASDTINQLSFDLEGDTVTFHFVPDENTAAFGYYAVVTTDSRVSITDASGEPLEPEEGVYTFHNQKVPVLSTSVTFGGTKTLVGKDLAEGAFTFQLVELDGDGDEPVTVTNAADGSFSFPAIQFSEEGTYTYEVSEVIGEDQDILYDGKVYTLTVDVAPAEDGSGQLVPTISGDSEIGTDLDFTNTYEEDEGGEIDPGPAPGGDDGGSGVPKSGDRVFPWTMELLIGAVLLGAVLIALALGKRRH